MAQIAVIGMNSFGFHVAKSLTKNGNEVLAMDQQEAIIDRIKTYVSKAVVADATDKTVLRELNMSQMDAVVLSLGSKLDASILVAMHLLDLNVKNIVAKAVSDDHVKILERIGVHKVVFLERDMGERIAASLQGVHIMDYLPIGKDLSIIEMSPLQEMHYKNLIELDFRNRYNCQVLAVRDTQTGLTLTPPEPTTSIEPHHVLTIMGAKDLIAKLSKKK
ncbi:potassium channel family protein [Desulfatibacillum aliphaticivorans]|uniref:TrkA-N domain protein n=1 Tax=Desulfatibacillum aliphaticivorans TaxID=218208 RepID=B8FDP7_DESAL|nr:TrkA family potassium uptake protein [Desulfatibacillum aliphaticivorans]ACL06678.1 TrkA-N domain protein [Desulfatibacillum aliphaticivorans]